MAVVRQLVTQGGADTTTSVAVSTGLTADGKSLWSLVGVVAYWVDGAAAAAGDWSLQAYIGTVTGAIAMTSADRVGGVAWGMQNTAGVAVAVPYEPERTSSFLEARVTAQPNIYVTVESAGTGQANDVIFQVIYEIVKASDLEVLRLLAGGA